MSQVFPYGITLQEGGTIAVFPASEVSFSTVNGELLSLFLIVDSGATVSALPKEDAKMLGINAEKGVPTLVSGISGEPLHGWRHEIAVRLGTEEIDIPVLFLDHENAPRVLGREGIFDHFTIIFEQPQRRTGFIGNNTNMGAQIRSLLNTVSQ